MHIPRAAVSFAPVSASLRAHERPETPKGGKGVLRAETNRWSHIFRQSADTTKAETVGKPSRPERTDANAIVRDKAMIEERQEKPEANFTDANGNVFNLMAIASRALKRAGMATEADAMQHRVCEAQSYDEALQIMMEYVDVC